MTIKKIKSSDILGDNYYIYNLTSSNYTPNLNGSITITCTVKNIYGDVIANKSIQLYQNDTAVGNATTTNNNGVVTWTITCSTAGIQKFSVKDTVIEVFVDTTSKTGHNHTTSDITDFPEIPTKTSDLTNDSNFLTSHQSLTNYIQKSNTNGLIKNDGTIDTNTYLTTHQDISGKANTADLGETAFSNDYNDLDNLPTIPAAYTHPSTHPATMITGLSTVATSGSYNDLSNKPSIPTKTSDLTNDNGYLTSHQDISGKANTADLGEVAFSNDYEDLDNLPTIPSAYTHPTTHPSSMITDSNTHSNIGNTTNTLENIITNIDTKLSSFANVDLIEVTSSLGTASANTMNKLYLVAETTSATNDNYEIFVTVRTGTSGNYSYNWEKVDTARIDLSNYLTTTNAQQTYVAKETGKGLFSGSYNDLTNKPTIPSASTTVPSADTTNGAYGSGTTYARANHQHPKSSLYAEASHNHTTSDITDFPTIPTKTSELTNDSNFLTSHQDITDKENASNKVKSTSGWSSTITDDHYPSEKLVKSSLDNKVDKENGKGLFSGSYGDLSNKPSYTATVTSSTTGAYKMGSINISGSSVDIYGKDTHQSLTDYIQKTSTDTGYLKSNGDIASLPTASTSGSGIVQLSNSTSSSSETLGATAKAVKTVSDNVTGKENSANKVSSWSATTNDTRYPSEKLVKDSLDTKLESSDLVDELNDIILDLINEGGS